VPAPPPRLRPDMTMSVDILVGRLDGALTLPSEAVRDLASGSPWVLLPKDGRAVRRDVTLGLRGTGMVEIAAGLSEGDFVLLPRSRALSPGQRVSYEPVGG
jgi:HlyD family secretion protein